MSDWEKVIPKPRSVFLRIKCPACGNEQIVFSHATTVINCNICSEILAAPSGGKAEIKGEIVAIFD
jgi:small subunit ribosomal protein S27e